MAFLQILMVNKNNSNACHWQNYFQMFIPANSKSSWIHAQKPSPACGADLKNQPVNNVSTKTTTPPSKSNEYQQFQVNKRKIYSHIANDMDKWRNFARELEISESRLVNLEGQFNRDIISITHQILLIAEEKFQREMPVKLCEALAKARRGDLARYVKEFI